MSSHRNWSSPDQFIQVQVVATSIMHVTMVELSRVLVDELQED